MANYTKKSKQNALYNFTKINSIYACSSPCFIRSSACESNENFTKLGLRSTSVQRARKCKHLFYIGGDSLVLKHRSIVLLDALIRIGGDG